MNVVAHGIGTVQDLPIPAWLFYWGAIVVLVVSFVLLGARGRARCSRRTPEAARWASRSRASCSAR